MQSWLASMEEANTDIISLVVIPRCNGTLYLHVGLASTEWRHCEYSRLGKATDTPDGNPKGDGLRAQIPKTGPKL